MHNYAGHVIERERRKGKMMEEEVSKNNMMKELEEGKVAVYQIIKETEKEGEE
jgi:hypothetical protein